MNKIKKITGWLLAWSLFWIGDFVSKIMDWTHFWFLYLLYNKLMGMSCDIQDWANISGPWKDVSVD